MTREDAVKAVQELASHLEADLAEAQTRDQHMRIASRITEARRIETALLA